MVQSYQGAVDSIKVAVGLGAEVTDTSIALAERQKVAQLRVDDFFSQVFAQVARLHPLPGALGQVLRDQEGSKISPAGIARAVELAAAAQALNAAGPDSTGAVRPAAGPPPVGPPPSSQP
jgi:hypothetical protein